MNIADTLGVESCRFLTWYCRGYHLSLTLWAIVWRGWWSSWARLFSSGHPSHSSTPLVNCLILTFDQYFFELNFRCWNFTFRRSGVFLKFDLLQALGRLLLEFSFTQGWSVLSQRPRLLESLMKFCGLPKMLDEEIPDWCVQEIVCRSGRNLVFLVFYCRLSGYVWFFWWRWVNGWKNFLLSFLD